MRTKNATIVAGSMLALLLLAGGPAAAVTIRGDGGARAVQRPGAAAAARSSANREGLVQSLNVAAQSIVINGSRYVIGTPQLALLDKRPKADGLLTLAGVKAGMFVRYRLEKTSAGDRVVELWVLRDPQQALRPRP
jgi:hypothetical protein